MCKVILSDRLPALAVIHLFVLLFCPLMAQEKDFPRDTSFTLSNTAPKVYKQYPQAILVEAKLPDSVFMEKNIVYAAYGKRELHLDLFSLREKGKTPRPGVLLIHGGGWRSGNRQMEWPMAQYLAARGYVTVTAEYRLSPEAQYPAGLYDLKGAVRWMRANARKYNLDPDKIAVYGCSAGGTLAAFLGTTGDEERFEGTAGYTGTSSRIQAVVDVDGVMDFTDPAESAKDDDPAKPSAGRSWFGASYREKPDLWREASPINYVSKKTPPVLFVNSAQDRYHAGRDEMIAQLNQLGIYSEVHTISNTPHPFWLFHPWFDLAADYILTFLNKILK